MAKRQLVTVFLAYVILAACKPDSSHQSEQAASAARPDSSASKGTFAYDLRFLRQHQQPVLLASPDSSAQVLVSPAYQGRVMTSTATGPSGVSYGWINYDLIASGQTQPHMNAYGGEDRFWLGPEGGQFGLYFKKGDPFDFEHWQTPAAIDTEPFEVTAQTADKVSMRKEFQLENYAGTPFGIRVNRQVRLLSRNEAAQTLGIPIPDSIQLVGYASDNQITNVGKSAWKPETGLLSIWILGMFNPSPTTTIVVPYHPKSTEATVVNDTYFGKVPADRLKVTPEAVFFRADGQYRSKIGVSPGRAKDIVGSYDAGHQVLTLVKFTLPEQNRPYVNSAWEKQREPFKGDVVNSYNDGPPQPGAKPMGPFYELESSSPAAALKPNESLTHVHQTFHLQGSEEALDPVARQILGVNLSQIKTAFAEENRSN